MISSRFSPVSQITSLLCGGNNGAMSPLNNFLPVNSSSNLVMSDGYEDVYKKPIETDRFFGIGFISKYLIAVTEIVVRGGESIKDTAWNLYNTI